MTVRRVICIDNSGSNIFDGKFKDFISVGEEVTVLYEDGCCYKIVTR